MANEQNKIGYGIRPLPKAANDGEDNTDKSLVAVVVMVLLGIAVGLVIGWLGCHPASGFGDLVKEVGR